MSKSKPPKKYEIKDIFKQSAMKMRAEFQEIQNTTSHNAVKGYMWEEVFRNFLQSHLPDSLDVTRGFIIDSYGNQSREVDIIIADKAKTPIFYKRGDARIIPVESVYAVIEVKTNIGSKEIKDIFRHLSSIKNLKKNAYVQIKTSNASFNACDLTNVFSNLTTKSKIKKDEEKILVNIEKSYPVYGTQNKIWPIHYFVFANNSIQLKNLKKNIEKENKTRKLADNKRIDLVCILEKGLIANQSEDGLLPFSSIGTNLVAVENYDFSLMTFFGLMSNVLLAAELPGNIKYTDYMPQN